VTPTPPQRPASRLGASATFRTGAARPPAPPRRKRWWLRVLVVLAVIGAIGLAGFTWFAYWPLEGSVPRVDALVPSDVDFLYRTSWSEIKATGWVRKNVFDDPVHPSLDPKKAVVDDRTLEQALERVPQVEAQIHGSIPGALRALDRFAFGPEFRVERDLFPGEVVAAGRWCSGGSPAEGPPKWREILLLTRVSSRMKFVFEAMGHEFVRKRVAIDPDTEVTETSDGLLRFETRTVRQKPQVCEGGHEVAPMNVWYVGRRKDVLAIGNAADLVAAATAKGGVERAIDGREFDMERPEGSLVAGVDLVGLRSYLTRSFNAEKRSVAGIIGTFVGKFIAVDALQEARATVRPLDDGIDVRADVSYVGLRMREFREVAATYEQPLQDVANGMARFLPAKDTAVVIQVSTPAKNLLRAVYDSLPPGDQQLLGLRIKDLAARQLEKGERPYQDVGDFLDDLAGHLGSETGVAVARMSSVFHDDMFQEWYYAKTDPVPSTAVALMLKIREGTKQSEVEDFLADRVSVLASKPPERVKSPDGIEYSRLVFEDVPPEYALYTPAFKVHDDYLILAFREDYLLEILKVMRGGSDAPPSVASTKEFRDVTASLPPKSTLMLYAHADNLRALAWDYRNPVVRGRHDDREHLNAFRAKRIRDMSRARGQVGVADLNLDAEMAAEGERFRTEGYRQFIADYRAELDSLRRIAAFGFALSAHRGSEKLDVGARLLLRPTGTPSP
jgi:hypothetical protein